jgi:hypothetical protein
MTDVEYVIQGEDGNMHILLKVESSSVYLIKSPIDEWAVVGMARNEEEKDELLKLMIENRG